MSLVKKVATTIEKYGIPLYVKPFLEKLKSMTEDDVRDLENTLQQEILLRNMQNGQLPNLTKFVRMYHKHCHFQVPFEIADHESADHATYRKPECQFRAGIARITLFTFTLPSTYANRYTQDIIDFLDECETAELKGLVLDFRKHGGGNMWPLVKALSRYLNGSTLFAWRNKRVYKTERCWYNWIQGTLEWKNQPFLVGPTPPYPIAVLIGPQTSSSGEFVASCFIQRPKCRLFGKRSGGYLSVNNTRPILGYQLTFPESLQTSRNGKFQEYIDPDVDTSRPLTDALEWVR